MAMQSAVKISKFHTAQVFPCMEKGVAVRLRALQGCAWMRTGMGIEMWTGSRPLYISARNQAFVLIALSSSSSKMSDNVRAQAVWTYLGVYRCPKNRFAFYRPVTHCMDFLLTHFGVPYSNVVCHVHFPVIQCICFPSCPNSNPNLCPSIFAFLATQFLSHPYELAQTSYHEHHPPPTAPPSCLPVLPDVRAVSRPLAHRKIAPLHTY